MELAMILLDVTISLLCLDLASSSSGSFTSSFTNLSISFSYKMRMILYFHAMNFSAPSIFSSILVFLVIFNIMRTSKGTGRESTYLKKIVFGWPPSGILGVWCRNPNLSTGNPNRVKRWKICSLLMRGRLYLPFSDIDDETLRKLKP